MRPRKVVAVLHLADPSGPSRSLAPVLERLAADAEVVVAVPSLGRAADELRPIARIVATGHAPLLIPRGPRQAAALVAQMRAEVRRFRELLRHECPDLVLVATTALPAAALAARLEGVPTIVYAAELYRQGSRGDPLRAIVGRVAVRLNERLATVVVACSSTVAARFRRPDLSVVVYPAVDPAVARGDAEAFRRRHGLNSDGPVIATLGNLTRGRGQDVAIRALADLRRDHPGAQLVIAGLPHPRPADRAFAAGLVDLVREAGLDGAVHLCGFERAADVFAAADVVVNPARSGESFGIVATEALVAGRPVVSTAGGAVPEVLRDGEHALLVPSGRPDALAAAVRRLLAEPALAERLTTAGRAHVLESFSAERQLPRFDAAIARALASGQPVDSA
jgi:glycosyltransferase involved in cell wall biosynthesis